MDRLNSKEEVVETPLSIAKGIVHSSASLKDKVSMVESAIIEARKKLSKEVFKNINSSLGDCVEGNDYEIVVDKRDGRRWINHKEVGSGEPLEQFIRECLRK